MNVDLGAYRKHNSDLSAKSDEELLKHFEVHGQLENACSRTAIVQWRGFQ